VCACLVCASCGRQETKQAPGDIAEARQALIQRDFTGAEKSFEQYLRRNHQGPDRWEAWNQLVGIALTVRQDNKAAIELLEAMRMEFTEDRERLRQVIRRLGSLYQGARRYNRAVALWMLLAEDEEALPEDRAAAYRDMAEIYLRRLEFELAKEALDQCLARPVSGILRGQCLYDRAQTFMAEDNMAEAIANLRAVLDQEGVSGPLRSLSMFMLADALEQQGDLGESLKIFEQLRGTYPNPKVMEQRIALLKKRMHPSK
jgi:tetratricopeptide (TPR) repeat protein